MNQNPIGRIERALRLYDTHEQRRGALAQVLLGLGDIEAAKAILAAPMPVLLIDAVRRSSVDEEE